MSFYSLLRNLIGIAHLCLAGLMIHYAVTRGVSWPVAMIAIYTVIGLLLAQKPFIPSFIQHPQGRGGVFGALLLYLILGAVSLLAGLAGPPADLDPVRTLAAVAPGVLTLGLLASFMLPIGVMLAARVPAMVAPVREHAQQDDAPTTPTAVKIHRALLGVFGLSAVALSGSILWMVTQGGPQFDAIYGGLGAENTMRWQAGLGVLAGLSLAFGIQVPKAVGRPSRWYHFFAVGIYTTFVSIWATLAAVITPTNMSGRVAGNTASYLERYDYFYLAWEQMPGYWAMIGVGALSSLGLIVSTIVAIRTKPITKLRPYSSQTTSDMPKVSKKQQRARQLPEAKLPAIGAMMKLYVAADWVVMRLLGLGLLGTAYLIYQMVESGRTLNLPYLTFGFPPLHALIAFGVVGTLMALPFLMPRFIARPSNVFGGLAKSFLMVAVAFVLLTPLHVAIDVFTPDIYHATLHATVPNVFKAVAGIAVTAALLISFFRQLGKTQKVDYQGRPVVIMSDKELFDLRKARMDG